MIEERVKVLVTQEDGQGPPGIVLEKYRQLTLTRFRSLARTFS